MGSVQSSTQPFSISEVEQLAEILSISVGYLSHVLSIINRYYRREDRPKKTCGKRTLHKPQGALKEIQARIKTAILDGVQPLPCAHGGVTGRSIGSNAMPHVGKEALLVEDIEHCFPSITPPMVLRVFNELGFSGQAVRILTRLTTFNYRLPQGAPTSTGLANLALAKLDRRFLGLAAQQGFSYTRYVDDLALSGSCRLAKFRRLVHRMANAEGFRLKTKGIGEIMLQSEPQSLTGLTVNRRVNVPKSRRADIRREALADLKGIGKLSTSTRGKMAWIRSVNKGVGTRLLRRFESE